MSRFSRIGFMICFGLVSFSGVAYAYSEWFDNLGVWNEVTLYRKLEQIEKSNQELAQKGEAILKRIQAKDAVALAFVESQITAGEAIRQFSQIQDTVVEYRMASLDLSESALDIVVRQLTNHIRGFTGCSSERKEQLQRELMHGYCEIYTQGLLIN